MKPLVLINEIQTKTGYKYYDVDYPIIDMDYNRLNFMNYQKIKGLFFKELSRLCRCR